MSDTPAQQRAYVLRNRIAELESLLTETKAELAALSTPAPNARPLAPGDPVHTTGPLPSYGYLVAFDNTNALIRLRTTGYFVNVPLSNLVWGHAN